MNVKLYQSQIYLHYSRPLSVAPAWLGNQVGCIHVDITTLEGDVTASFRMNPANAKQLADMILSALAEGPWAEDEKGQDQ